MELNDVVSTTADENVLNQSLSKSSVINGDFIPLEHPLLNPVVKLTKPMKIMLK